MSNNARLYWLLAGLAGAGALYLYYRNSQSFQNALSNAGSSSGSTSIGGFFSNLGGLSGFFGTSGSSTNSGGLVQSLTQLPQDLVGTVDRGFRNNNPGNIKGSDGFNGQTGVDSQNFAIFSSMEYGIRAIAVILKNYENVDGLNTVREMITRWSTTDQSAYVANVAAMVGVAPDDYIDVNDPTVLAAMIQGIITQENGQLLAATITGSQIQNGIALA